MTSRWHSHNYSTSDLPECDVMDSSQPSGGAFYDYDSLRPKSFLRDEVDEFNRILDELLQSRQRPEPLAFRDDVGCCCSSSQDGKDGSFQMTQRDHRRTNCCLENSDLEIQNITDFRYDCLPDTDAIVAGQCTVETGHDDDVELVDSFHNELKIVEEADDRLQPAKNDNIQPSLNIFTDDLFHEDDADSGYQSGNSTMVGPATQLSSAYSQLRQRIDCYNVFCRGSGLAVTIAPDSDVFQGFIRVHMNLHKPISVLLRSYDVTASGNDVTTETESFCLPPNTSRIIHIDSEMTTLTVIQTLLDKFLITDSCQKFALYEKINIEHPNTPEERRLNGMLRRLTDDEKPLQLCLRWSDDGADSLNRRQFLLQDNVTSEIAWDSFSLPELEAFLRILDREEESYHYQIRLKFGAKKKAAEMRLKQLANDSVISA